MERLMEHLMISEIKSETIAGAMPCAYINSYESPISKGNWLSFSVRQRDDELVLSGTRRYEYPHPQAPEYARLTVLVDEDIISCKSSDEGYGVLYGLLMSQKTARMLIKEIERKEKKVR
jgi:hypothetical protein